MKLFLKVLFKDFYHNIASKEAREFLRLLFLYGDKKRFTGTELHAGGYRLYVPDTLSFIWQYKEIFVDENYKFKSTSGSPVIYDCGANIGMSCLYFKKLYPQAIIKAFEADNKIAGVLKDNLTNNDASDVEVINKAVWINDSGIEMTHGSADAASIFSAGEKIKVDSVRLKDLIEDEERINLLKIDIEGAEFDVLNDCKDSLLHIEHIFIECHTFIGVHQQLGKLFSVLEENNFRYFVKPEQDRSRPFINRTNKNYPEMDLQINIFAYRQ